MPPKRNRPLGSVLGNAIKTRRLALGLTQQELADKAQLSLSKIARWERRPTAIAAEDLAKLIQVLGEDIVA
ncbi:MAG: helix-turn-helix transcriptional regulator [Chloroflexi bacterium]|nr:helix-turn-helix transcriptional regulator [Chloroflexota bacterium]